MLFAKCGVQIAGIIFQARSRGVLRGKMEKLYKKLESYGKSDFYPFHMPGHKRNKKCVEGDFPLERDITEIYDFDDLHHPEGILMEAQNALSRLYGTKASFFSVNGSTAGLLTAISASVKRGGQILGGKKLP